MPAGGEAKPADEGDRASEAPAITDAAVQRTMPTDFEWDKVGGPSVWPHRSPPSNIVHHSIRPC